MLKYSIEWHDDATNMASEERATVADLRLFLDRQNVTLHLREYDSIDHLTISLYGLVEGLAHDWWNLFGGRDREFSLLKYRSGYVVPDIRMSFDGAVFSISAIQCTYRNPDVRFWVGPTVIMNRQEAESGLEHFIEEVLDRLASRGIRETSAAQRWARIRASRTEPDEAVFCEAAGALGLDPYQIDEEHSELVEQASALFEGEALPEFLAGTGSLNWREILRWIAAVEHRPRHLARLAELEAAAHQAANEAPAKTWEQSWSLGYRRARAMRLVLGIQSGDRFRSFKDLAEKLGASPSFDVGGRVDGLSALRSDHSDGTYIHLRDRGGSRGAQSSQLFSFTRAIGDAACFTQQGRSAVNGLHSAYRQAAGRAFAAEFLAPIDEVRSMRDDGNDAISIADEFGVSEMVIERQWENRERIDLACSQ